MTMNNSGNIMGQQFGDTTLTKVFVGGLAWEMQKETLREHFEQYGEILEAVIIYDKLTGRSKGYGFVTFQEAEAAKKACEDAMPVINGRRSNCNLASLGARRPRASTPQQLQGSNGGARPMSSTNATQYQWYYPAGRPASPYHHHPQGQAVPFYGYPYYAADYGYDPKMGYGGGAYVNGSHFSPQMYGGNSNTMMPVYPVYHFHQSQPMGGVPARMFTTTTAGPATTTVPTLISKPPSMAPNAVCLAVE